MTERTMLRPVTPVGILAAELDALVASYDAARDAGRDAGRDDGRDDGWLARLRGARDLAAGLEPYLAEATSPESPSLAALAERTRGLDWESGPLEAEMLSGHVEGRLLRTLVRATGARRVLEVGMFTGYSALAMAQALPGDGHVVALELDPRAAQVAQQAFDSSPGGGRIEVRLGPATQSLRELTDRGETFDLVFLDADKAGYAAYLRLVLDGLLAPHGLVVVDNTLMQGEPWTGARSESGRAVTDFNRAVAEDPGVEQVLLPLRDGVTLLMRAAS